MDKFGTILRHLRLSYKFTQKELSKQIGVTDRSIRDWENRGVEPCYDTLIRLADIFDVTLDELLGRE